MSSKPKKEDMSGIGEEEFKLNDGSIIDRDGFYILRRKTAQDFTDRRTAKISEQREKKTNGKNKENSKKKFHLIYWEYDGGATIGCVLKSNSQFSEHALLKSPKDIDTYTERRNELGIKPCNLNNSKQ